MAQDLLLIEAKLKKYPWLAMSSCNSPLGAFKFSHHSTASVVNIEQVDSDGNVTGSINMDYIQWHELCQLIKALNP